MDSNIKELISFAVYSRNFQSGRSAEMPDKKLEKTLESLGCEIIYDEGIMKVFTPNEGQIKHWRC